MPAGSLAQSGSGKGHSQRARTISAGTAKTTLKMERAPVLAGNVAGKRGARRTCPHYATGGGGLDMIST